MKLSSLSHDLPLQLHTSLDPPDLGFLSPGLLSGGHCDHSLNVEAADVISNLIKAVLYCKVP
jgi:hypothetical protein